ncbi:hypothetical protein [Cupriavidus basilensis]|uniref:hypothetical protein n=1 Tax=Cupriavidus basilensis TaxID=68895 RepID=UPI00157B991C|nr:hypothetical protein [Cupriavidus basilensis]NUA27872.1 hypothetical protein [Cupriavidus basilensis]
MAYWLSARFALRVARRITRGNRSVRQTLAPPRQFVIATKEGVLWLRDAQEAARSCEALGRFDLPPGSRYDILSVVQ